MDGKSLNITEETFMTPWDTHEHENNSVFSYQKDGYNLVNENEISLILKKIDESIIKAVISEKPKKFITLDCLFKNNDQLKTNTALQMKDEGIEFKAV